MCPDLPSIRAEATRRRRRSSKPSESKKAVSSRIKKANQMRKITALLIIGISIFSPVVGQNPNPQSTLQSVTQEKLPDAAAVSSGTHELTAADAEAYLDGIVPLQLAREDIAGATIAIVKDGKVLFEK